MYIVVSNYEQLFQFAEANLKSSQNGRFLKYIYSGTQILYM